MNRTIQTILKRCLKPIKHLGIIVNSKAGTFASRGKKRNYAHCSPVCFER